MKYVTMKQLRDKIREVLFCEGVHHDDLDNFTDAILKGLEEIGLFNVLRRRLRKVVQGREYILQRVKGAPHAFVHEADGTWRELEHVVLHSPTGFEWGYNGSGPADLSLSILCDLIPAEEAKDLYQQFKAEVIAQIPREGAYIAAVDVLDWIENKRQESKLRGGEKVETAR